ncbi:hypothetical protein CIL03_11410 [Virgibacillus indicus]|uniref:DNA-binding response regulator n=1 Tax=Virgibacillus indicus TaxID=2024554 RepID=A0A265N8V6_9BACI|nr:response regulator [Virgibacillus indicus]OZU88255.1 hypothetical protein CIL03_11410 [Virgibacillus indicus]
MRILIAEDELLERKAMKKFIDDNFTNMAVIGEAANGRMAIELAESLNPDIILMDIKMPGINGLEAIEAINAKHPQVKFILVSAYDSFDYAKEAMRFGIKDYILKPGKKEEIVKTLLRVAKEIEAERENTLKSAELLKEKFISKAMQLPLAGDFTALKEEIFPEMKSGCFFVIKSLAESNRQAAEQAVKANIDGEYILHQADGNLVLCILASQEIKKPDVLTLARKLSIAIGETNYIGAGFPVQSLEKLPKSYHDAYAASVQLANEGKSNYGFMQTVSKNNQNAVEQISHLVEKGHASEAVMNYKKLHLTESEKEDLYIAIKNIIDAKQITLPKTSFSSLYTEADWHSFLHLCCLGVNEYYQSKNYIEKAKQYIHEHFNEAISLEDVAVSVDLSPNYFSNMFKQEFGMSFIDFLTKVRLEKAKELIEGNSHSLKEISFMIGYKDPNYFSRVFKKYYQESPKQFQQSIFKK